jgi:hypothetical protein
MKKDYNSFVAYKRSVHPAPFNWSDDGCSGPFLIRPVYRSLFNRPCQLHDFGYRNYGGGLRLGATRTLAPGSTDASCRRCGGSARASGAS